MTNILDIWHRFFPSLNHSWLREQRRWVMSRQIYQQNGNLIWQQKSTRKGIKSTSGAQFAVQPLVKPSIDVRMPLSFDVPILLLNQPSDLVRRRWLKFRMGKKRSQMPGVCLLRGCWRFDLTDILQQQSLISHTNHYISKEQSMPMLIYILSLGYLWFYSNHLRIITVIVAKIMHTISWLSASNTTYVSFWCMRNSLIWGCSLHE